ncbi:MAG: hypothetical protein WCO48_02485 [Candidatus Taylorbacteria bacterium]
MSRFSFNPNILPPNKSISSDTHRQHIVAGVVAAILAIFLGIAYYIWGVQKQADSLAARNATAAQIIMAQQKSVRAQIIDQLQNSSTTQPTAAQKKQLIAAMNKATTTVTDTQKKQIIELLNTK